MSGEWKRGTVEMVGHPRTKGRVTGENKPRPKPPRHSSTLQESGRYPIEWHRAASRAVVPRGRGRAGGRGLRARRFCWPLMFHAADPWTMKSVLDGPVEHDTLSTMDTLPVGTLRLCHEAHRR